MSKRKKNPKFTAVVVSYVPLLRGEAGRSDLDMKELELLIGEADGTAKACVWLHDSETGPTPVLLFDGARELAEHLREWAEDKPEEWFRLVLGQHGDLYGLALIPVLEKGVERFRMAYQLRNGLPIPKDASFQCIFKPLQFTSLPGNIFDKIRPELQARTNVCLMDMADYHGPDTNFDDVHILGVFDVVTEGPLVEYVVDSLKASEKS